jgi:hypothetical protein
MFDNEEYKKYNSLMGKAGVVKYSEGVLEISNKKKKQLIKYKPPVYKNVNDSLRTYYREYQDKCVEYIHSGRSSILKDMNSLLDEIDALVYYSVIINSKTKLDKESLASKIGELYMQVNDIEKDYKEIIELQNELFGEVEKMKLLDDIPVIDFYIQHPPERLADEVMVPNKITKPPRKDPIQAQVPVAATVPNILKHFPFHKLPVKIKTLEECNTRSNKKPYYISLKDLISAIDKDDELKEIFGPKYKKMTKKDMCAIMLQ